MASDFASRQSPDGRSSTPAAGKYRPVTATERNWARAAAIFLGSLAVFGAIYAIEMDLGRWNRDIRLVRDPAQASMHFLGISHFLVAVLYSVTSKRMRSVRSWARFGLMLGVGALLCVGYARLYAASALAAGICFFTYFLVHDLRDQVFFYFSNGDAPEAGDPPGLARVLGWCPFLVTGALAAVAIPAVLLGLPVGGPLRPQVSSFPAWFLWPLAVLPAPLVTIVAMRLSRVWRRGGFGTVSGFVRANRPILLVFAATALNLLLGAFLGWGAHGIVIMHVVTWYVFIMTQFARRPPAARPPRGWRWVRDTPTGFNLLHVGSVLLLIAAGAVWAYGFRNDPSLTPLWVLLNGDNFRYWTILHVTVSFGSR